MTNTAETDTNISKLSPTHFASNIRHQHRCSPFSFTKASSLRNVFLVLCNIGFHIRSLSWYSLHLVFLDDSVTSWWRWHSIWIRVSFEKKNVRKLFVFRLCLYMGWLGTALSFATTYLVLVGSGSEEGIGKTDHLEQWSNLPNRTMSRTDHKGEKMANWYQSMRKESMQVYI